jgi:hypothetical protein
MMHTVEFPIETPLVALNTREVFHAKVLVTSPPAIGPGLMQTCSHECVTDEGYPIRMEGSDYCIITRGDEQIVAATA